MGAAVLHDWPDDRDAGPERPAVVRRRHPRPDPRSRSRRLVEAGAQAVAELGYTRATVHEICRRAEVAIGTFYTTFSDKAELFAHIPERAAFLELAADDLLDRARLESALEDHLSGPARDLVRAWDDAARYEPALRALDRRRSVASRARLGEAVSVARGRRAPVAVSDAGMSAWVISTLVQEAARGDAEHDRPVASALATVIWRQVHGSDQRGTSRIR
jgi:AcrR family transcriptional regulator